MVKTTAKRWCVLVLATMGVVALGERGAGAQVLGRFETVASSGQALPAGGGVGTLGTFGNVVINASGSVAFGAALLGTSGGAANDTGAFLRVAGGSLRFVAREGQAAPGGNGLIGNVVLNPAQLNDADQVMMLLPLTGTSGGLNDDTGLFGFNSVSEVLSVFARENAAVAGGNLGSMTNINFASDNSVGFNTNLRNTVGGFSDDATIFSATAINLDLLAREGNPTPLGGTFGTPSAGAVVISNQRTAFSSTVSGVPGVNSALFRSNDGSIQELVRTGDTAPGGVGTFDALNASNVIINESGQVLFSSTLDGTANGSADGSGIFRTDGTTTVTIMRRGAVVPKGVGTISSFQAIRFNNRGQGLVSVVLDSTTRGGDDDEALYLGSGSTLVEIVREGNAVPGGDGEFNFFSGVLTDTGFVAFSASIQFASSPAVDSGIYLSDGVDMIQVARKGQAFGGSTITSLALVTFSNSTSSRAVNESGQVAHLLSLANGGQQVVVFTPNLRYRSASGGSWDTASRWTLGITPNEIHDVTIDPAVSLTVTGPANAVTVRSLVVGGANGIGTLSLAGGTITATNGVTVAPTGVLTGDGVVAGTVVNAGTVRAANLAVSGTLTNNGLVTGSGRLTAAIVNTAAGEIRVEPGARLILGGASLSNAGRVDLLGTPESPAELETNVLFANAANTGLIAGRNAILRFDGGLNNAGSVALSSGVSDVFGDVNNVATGRISITGGAAATFYDDVTQNGILRVATVGNTRSVAVFLGGFTGAGGATGGGDIFFEGDLRPGNSPAFVNFDANVSFGPGVVTFMELGGLGDGEYDRITVSGVLALDGVLDVRFLAGLEPSGGTPVTYKLLQAGALVGDFDSILLPTLVGRDWFVQRTDTSLTIGSFTVIPEPGWVGAIGLFGMGLLRRRR